MNRLRLIVVGAVGAALGVVLLLMSGVLNFAASTGHWDITDLFFDMAARQSVTARSIGIHPPDLDDPSMIRRGAGHYEMVCASCHGSPGRPPEVIAANLTPKPPLLVEQMQRWRPPERIFWTVKHGIKRTGMPAWPTQLRDDEVWDMVAFLRVMSGLTAETYRELAGDRRLGTCANCHGEDGRRLGAFPRLDIQSPEYLADALRAYRDGTRASGTMIAAASALTDVEIAELARSFGSRTPVTLPEAARPGRDIWERGVPERDIAACQSCHGTSARGDFPQLAGQDTEYVERQLTLFSSLGSARGGRHAGIMARAAHGLTPEEIRDLAEWLGRE